MGSSASLFKSPLKHQKVSKNPSRHDIQDRSIAKTNTDKASKITLQQQTKQNKDGSDDDDDDGDDESVNEIVEADDNVNEENVLASIEVELIKFSEMEEPWNEEGRKVLHILFKKYYGKKKRRNSISDLMIKHNFFDVCTRIWSFCHHVNHDDEFCYLKCKTYRKMKIVVWNYTDYCIDLVQYAYQQKDFIVKLMTDFSDPELDVANLKNKSRRFQIKSTLSILQNIVTNYNISKELIRLNEGIQNILKYYSSTFLIIKASVMLVLAYCINEEENDKLVTGTGVIEFIIRILGNALHTRNHIAKTYKYSAKELTRGLDKLAFNDDNKKSIVDAGILPLLNMMLSEKSSSKEHEIGSHCLWTLSFHPENKEKISKESALIESVRRVRDAPTSDEQTIRSCDGILFVVEGKEGDKLQSVTPQDKHIMISYQWGAQDIILKISEKLKSQGFSVWIDVDKMGQGSILSTMAKAVEKSSILLIAVTENYKNSNACRTEAEYAYKLSKPIFPLLLQDDYVPDGWLGAFVGVQFYMKITDSQSIDDSNLDELVTKLRSKMSSQSRDEFQMMSSDTAKTEPTKSTSKQTLISRTSINQTLSCSSWSEEEVCQWFNDHVNIDQRLISKFDGIALDQLYKLLQRSPDVYYHMLKEDFHLEWIDLFHLTNALESLSNRA